MKLSLKTALATACLLGAAQAGAQITFYEHEGFGGRSFNTERQVNNFDRFGFNDRASSVVVANDRWEVCQDADFAGRCVVLRPGSYTDLAALGLNDRISSVRMVGRSAAVADERYSPGPQADYYDARRRNNERLYQANVTSVRAVVGPAEQRCWVEREAGSQERERGSANVPAALAGAVLGGILGHQVGGGTGRDIATVGGAVGGAALGANIGRDRRGSNVAAQDVRRCENVASQGPPHHWDVTYTFRGQEHRMQASSPPGATITVNRQGEPRV